VPAGGTVAHDVVGSMTGDGLVSATYFVGDTSCGVSPAVVAAPRFTG